MHAEPSCKMQIKQHIYVNIIMQQKYHMVGWLIYKVLLFGLSPCSYVNQMINIYW